jgi:hypothetical protein
MEDYFPTYKEKYLPSRDFFWKTFGTLHYDDTNEFIQRIRDGKAKLEDETEKKTIEIDAGLLDEIYKAQHFTKKKGRALFVMNPDKIKAPKRRRKRIEIFRDEAEMAIINQASDNQVDEDEEEKERLIEAEMKKRLEEDKLESMSQSDKRRKEMKPGSEHKNSEGLSKLSYNELIHGNMSPDAKPRNSDMDSYPLGFPETHSIFAGKKTLGRLMTEKGYNLKPKDGLKSTKNPFKKH